MHPFSNSTPLTVGKLLGHTFGICRAHSGVFLRTAAIFYLPLAILSFFFVRDLTATTIFPFVIFPIETFASLALTAHCVELLHGRPLTVTTAVGRGLRRLPAAIGMMLAAGAVYLGVTLIAMTPIWVGLFVVDLPLDEIRDAFSSPINPGDLQAVMNMLGNALWGGIGSCFTVILILIAFPYLGARWIVVDVALMAEETGPLDSLARSWNLSRDFVLRSVGYLLLLTIALGLADGLITALVGFVSAPLLPVIDQSTQTGLNDAVSNLLSIFLTPFYVTALVLYYYDLRVRTYRYNFGVG